MDQHVAEFLKAIAPYVIAILTVAGSIIGSWLVIRSERRLKESEAKVNNGKFSELVQDTAEGLINTLREQIAENEQKIADLEAIVEHLEAKDRFADRKMELALAGARQLAAQVRLYGQEPVFTVENLQEWEAAILKENDDAEQ